MGLWLVQNEYQNNGFLFFQQGGFWYWRQNSFQLFDWPFNGRQIFNFPKAYHKVNPLTVPEIHFLKEAYRFFILNYVIKDGRYFFHEIFATKLQKEAYDIYFPSIEKKFNADKIINALQL